MKTLDVSFKNTPEAIVFCVALASAWVTLWALIGASL